MTHKLAEYLQKKFPKFHVDCEYNRHGDEIKKIEVPRDGINWDDIEQRTVFPDIVVHKRGNDKSNLIVIEVKKSTNSIDRQFDKKKLQAFTLQPYNYRLGFFLQINVNDCSEKYTLEMFKDGKPYAAPKSKHEEDKLLETK